MSSGIAKIESIDLSKTEYSTADVENYKINATYAKQEFNESLTILNNIPEKDLNEKELAGIFVIRTIIDNEIKYSDVINGKFSDYTKDLAIYNNENDCQNAANKIVDMRYELLGVRRTIDEMQNSLSQIDATKLEESDQALLIREKDEIATRYDDINRVFNSLQFCTFKVYGNKMLGIDCTCESIPTTTSNSGSDNFATPKSASFESSFVMPNPTGLTCEQKCSGQMGSSLPYPNLIPTNYPDSDGSAYRDCLRNCIGIL
jgi:hypothetical protein